jgi:hypothetical protein
LEADLLLKGHFGVIELKEEAPAFIEYWRSPVGAGNTLFCAPLTIGGKNKRAADRQTLLPLLTIPWPLTDLDDL